MKKTSLITLIFATSMAMAAPKIDPKRVDILLQYIKQTPEADPAQFPDDAQLRAEIEKTLQRNEVLKEQAIKVGLDQLPDTQVLLANAQAEVYANRFVRYLAEQENVSESELRQLYRQQTRTIRIEQVGFDSMEKAQAALDLLRKGMSFEQLMQQNPNPEQANMNQFISPNHLPPEIFAAVGKMVRGDITNEPVEFKNHFFIFKLAEEGVEPNAPAFEQMKAQLQQNAKMQRVQEKVLQILKQEQVE